MRKLNRSPLLKIGMTLGVAFMACIVAIGQDVRHNSMPGVDFSKYHTYKWVSIEALLTRTKLSMPKSSSQLTRNWLRKA